MKTIKYTSSMPLQNDSVIQFIAFYQWPEVVDYLKSFLTRRNTVFQLFLNQSKLFLQSPQFRSFSPIMRNEPRELNSNPVGHSACSEVGHQSAGCTAHVNRRTRSHVPFGADRTFQTDGFPCNEVNPGPKTSADGPPPLPFNRHRPARPRLAPIPRNFG